MIRSTFAGFTTAQLGMAASQRALDVTGQNIANINTAGYTRQRLDIASMNTKGGNFYNSNNMAKVGYGVDITGISNLRDPYLDSQYRSQIAKLGTVDAHAAGLEQLEPIFDETTMDGVRAALSSISSSLQELSKPANVSSKEFDSMVRSNMQILLNLFHENASRLEDVREDMTNGFQDNDVSDVNEMLKNIASLNESIKNSQLLGNPALELQDQRNQLLDELASYLPISVKYKDQEISPGQFVEILDVSFTDTNGAKWTLISDNKCGSLKADISGQPVTLSLASDAFGENQNKDITNLLPSGTLKGTLDMLNKSGSFDNSDVKGLGYYETSFDALVKKFAETFNDLNSTVDDQGNPVDNPLFEPIDGDWANLSASNIKIADGWTNGSYGITTSKKDPVEPGANDNVLAMIDALEAAHDFEGDYVPFFKGSFYQCFSNIENTLGIDLKSANTTLTNQITVLNQTANARDGISGVQLDEEGMNLMHYNQSYSAAARLMTTLDEALETLINKTGVVGR